MKSQKQRASEKRRKDKLDSEVSCNRAQGFCECCGVHAPYTEDIHSGVNHHDLRKNTYPQYRHDPRNHYWLCFDCHRSMHENYNEGRRMCAQIRVDRGDPKDLTEDRV